MTETLEEAAREYYKRGQLGFEKAADTEMAFIKGAKWQQERSYSEEEVLDLLFDFQLHRNDLENCVEAREWFEQLKKK